MKGIARLILCSLLSLACFYSVSFADEYESISIAPPPLSDTPIDRLANNDLSATSSQKISLNFSNIKIRELLQIMAQFTNLNFVISDNVKGEMSIHLHQVPWDQALNVILKSQNLGERSVGQVVYVAPIPELLNQRLTELEGAQRMRDLVATQDRVVSLNYANAEEIQKILVTNTSSLLSARGAVNIDKRTNSVWIRDTPDHVKTMVRLIHQLDHPVQQVLIEARLVTIRRRYEEQLGARFGLTDPNHLTGTLEGANTLAAGAGPLSVPLAQRLNFDARSSGQIFGATTPPGSIGLAVAKVGGSFIDMELSALEEQNNLDIISAPKLITSNQQPAYIETGEQIPYQESTSSGATAVSFKDALLKLEVTPQITPDNRVILKLKVTDNRPGLPINGQGGSVNFSIDTEEESSVVLLNNHQTVVLGGVYRLTKDNIVRRIPFLGKLPVIGMFFSEKDKRNDKNELLIFLTPHIIHKPSDISASG